MDLLIIYKRGLKSCIALAVALVVVLPSAAQGLNSERLKHHVNYLASDALEGRLAGSEGARKAGNYIRKQFREIGLEAGNKDSFFQRFRFNTPLKYGVNNYLVSGKDSFTLEKAYYPAIFSASKKASGKWIKVGKGIIDSASGRNDYKQEGKLEGKIFLIDMELPEGVHPHSPLWKFRKWRSRYRVAKQYDPAAIIFYNVSQSLSIEDHSGMTRVSPADIPLLVITGEALKNLEEKPAGKLQLSVELVRRKKTGINVVGELNHGAEQFIVMGAHYDHLGYGQYGNSRYLEGPVIHNGADDNASGVAMIIELARLIKEKGWNGFNYLFVAFSAEELGLLGSNHFVDHLETPGEINCMLNFDMVGRLDSNEKKLGLYGSGSSPAWDSLITLVKPAEIRVNTDPSGIGSSDHTNFYLEDIPVLHFFTGTHQDYHKPGDDPDKLNYRGMTTVGDMALELLKHLDNMSRLQFEKVEDSASKRKAPRFKVTLGIMPDYFYKKEGVRIDGVSPGETADKADMKKGDVIIRIGGSPVKDLYSYMEALSVFEKGDKTRVRFLRNEKEKEVEVQF